MAEKIQSIPEARLLLASLRSVGYNEETAIADIIDNCISAQAHEIKIQFDWEKKRIVILDDGIGMSEKNLIENMRVQFSKYMSGCNDVSWDNIWAETRRLIEDKEISVYSVNGKSEDVLLYKSHEGKPFNVIVIGGDKLSRGLTLEGLTVSYFTRSSNTYDLADRVRSDG